MLALASHFEVVLRHSFLSNEETLPMLRYNANSLYVHYFALLHFQHWEMNEYSVKVLGMAAVQMVSLLLSETTTKAVQILARY